MMYEDFEFDYDRALSNFRYMGGAVRLVEPVEKYEHGREWGHREKDLYTLPYGPWRSDRQQLPWVWRYGSASAGTGTHYEALATRVHADVASRTGGFIVVSVLSPWRLAYPVNGGPLDRTYVAEKFTKGTPHGGDLAAITKLINLLIKEDEE